MTSFLDDPKVRQAIFPLSVEVYHQVGELGLVDERVELLEGSLFKKPAKSPLHSWLVQFLFRLLEQSLPSELFLRKEEPLTFSNSEPEPDLAVVKRVSDNYRHAHPETAELVVEVAISTVEVDRQKAAIYAAAGVREYWLVIPATGSVEVYREPAAGVYTQRQTLTSPASLESSVVPGFTASLREMFQP